MTPNWTHAQNQFKQIINANGVFIEWLQRVTSGSDAYLTGSSVSYGYGDESIWWLTGSVKAVVAHIRAEEVLVEAGYTVSDYETIFVNPNETIEFWEQVIYPSGSGVRYLILPLHDWRMTIGDTLVAKYANLRRLVPASGSSY